MSDPRAHHVLASISRVALLEILSAAGRPLSVQQVADQMGLHPNTIRAHLNLLIEYGHVVRQRDSTGKPGRPRQVYAVSPPGDPAPPEKSHRRNFRLLASVLVEYLSNADDPTAAAVDAGRLFGERLVEPADEGQLPVPTTERVVKLLDDIGFQPELTQDGSAIKLRHCPFHELARSQPDVVCNVHLGLLRGALRQLGAPGEATRLIPFVTPQLCVVEMGPRPTE
jgi:predicted ArsR family transcriptional regulator